MEVKFTWNGKDHKGDLKQITGAGNAYHLMINGFYQGQLIRTATVWTFYTQKHGYIPELAALFGSKIDGQTT